MARDVLSIQIIQYKKQAGIRERSTKMAPRMSDHGELKREKHKKCLREYRIPWSKRDKHRNGSENNGSQGARERSTEMAPRMSDPEEL